MLLRFITPADGIILSQTVASGSDVAVVASFAHRVVWLLSCLVAGLLCWNAWSSGRLDVGSFGPWVVWSLGRLVVVSSGR